MSAVGQSWETSLWIEATVPSFLYICVELLVYAMQDSSYYLSYVLYICYISTGFILLRRTDISLSIY